jgi:AcrR family transcriptional regulator
MGVGLSREDWARAALVALAEEGLAAVAVDPLARRLGATKGSFYWHFANRDALIAMALELWEQRDTTEVIAAIDALADPHERLAALARFAFGEAARGTDPHAGVLAAASDPRVAPTLERVTRARLTTLERLYRDAGLDEADARRHARLAYALYVGTIDLCRAAPGELRSDSDVEAEIDLMVAATSPRATGLPRPRSYHGSRRGLEIGFSRSHLSAATATRVASATRSSLGVASFCGRVERTASTIGLRLGGQMTAMSLREPYWPWPLLSPTFQPRGTPARMSLSPVPLVSSQCASSARFSRESVSLMATLRRSAASARGLLVSRRSPGSAALRAVSRMLL